MLMCFLMALDAPNGSLCPYLMNCGAVCNNIRRYVPIWLVTLCEMIVKTVTKNIRDNNEVTQILQSPMLLYIFVIPTYTADGKD